VAVTAAFRRPIAIGAASATPPAALSGSHPKAPGSAGGYLLLGRLPMDEHPPVSILAGAMCVLAVAGCAPAYTKPSVALPHHTSSITEVTPAFPHVVHRAPPPSHISPTGVQRPVKTVIPLPDPGLLRPQAEPECEFPPGDTNADDRQKLDYSDSATATPRSLRATAFNSCRMLSTRPSRGGQAQGRSVAQPRSRRYGEPTPSSVDS